MSMAVVYAIKFVIYFLFVFQNRRIDRKNLTEQICPRNNFILILKNTVWMNLSVLLELSRTTIYL